MGNVYVNSSSLSEWETKLNGLNTTAVSDVEKLSEYSNEINSSFKGDFAESYLEALLEFSSYVKSSHESMKDFDTFLNSIVEIMNNQ